MKVLDRFLQRWKISTANLYIANGTVHLALATFAARQMERKRAFLQRDTYTSPTANSASTSVRVLPPSSVATRLRAVVQVRKRPGCAPQ